LDLLAKRLNETRMPGTGGELNLRLLQMPPERQPAPPARPLPSDLIVARDRTVVGRGAIAEVEHNLVHVTPSPAFGWVIAFDDRMARIVKVLRGVAVRRVVATANMAAGSA
jgi:hypothetical protein